MYSYGRNAIPLNGISVSPWIPCTVASTIEGSLMTKKSRTKRNLAFGAIVVAGALVFTGCSSSGTASTPASSGNAQTLKAFNDSLPAIVTKASETQTQLPPTTGPKGATGKKIVI